MYQLTWSLPKKERGRTLHEAHTRNAVTYLLNGIVPVKTAQAACGSPGVLFKHDRSMASVSVKQIYQIHQAALGPHLERGSARF